MEVNQRVRKNKNKNNFILHRSFVITNTSCQISFDEKHNVKHNGQTTTAFIYIPR